MLPRGFFLVFNEIFSTHILILRTCIIVFLLTSCNRLVTRWSTIVFHAGLMELCQFLIKVSLVFRWIDERLLHFCAVPRYFSCPQWSSIVFWTRFHLELYVFSCSDETFSRFFGFYFHINRFSVIISRFSPNVSQIISSFLLSRPNFVTFLGFYINIPPGSLNLCPFSPKFHVWMLIFSCSDESLLHFLCKISNLHLLRLPLNDFYYVFTNDSKIFVVLTKVCDMFLVSPSKFLVFLWWSIVFHPDFTYDMQFWVVLTIRWHISCVKFQTFFLGAPLMRFTQFSQRILNVLVVQTKLSNMFLVSPSIFFVFLWSSIVFNPNFTNESQIWFVLTNGCHMF